MNKLAAVIYKRSGWILAGGAVFVLLSMSIGTQVFDRLHGGGFEDKSSESYRVREEIQKSFGRNSADVVVLFSSNSGLKATDNEFRQAAQDTLDKIKDNPNVESISTYYDIGASSLISKDQNKTFAAINLKGSAEEQEEHFPEIQAKLTSQNLDIKLGGPIAFGEAISGIIEKDLARAETISFSVLAVLLIIVFRSLVAAALPLLLGGFAIMGAFLITRLITEVMDVSQFAINAIIFLGLGLAIDYSLFIVSRFREELRGTGKVSDALATTMSTAGKTVLFSGITVMLSLAGLMIFPLGFLKSMGAGGAAAVFISLIGALVLLPAILAKLGPRVNALSFGSVRRDQRNIKSGKLSREEKQSVWYRVSTFAMRNPVPVIILTLLPIIIAGLPFLRVQLQSPDYRSLPKDNEARIVSETLNSEFPHAGEPLQIVVKSNDNITTNDNIAALKTYTEKLRGVSKVENVESLVSSQPDLELTGDQDLLAEDGQPGAQLTRQLVSRDDRMTLVNVYFSGGTLDKDAQALVKQIRQTKPPAPLQAEVGGQTAQLVDLLATLQKYIPYALAFIVITLFILLFLMLGSIIIPIKAIVLNILSLSAAFGAIVWVFQDGHLENILGFESVGAIDSNQPVIIFAIAFGLSMDYAVFLLSRIKEQYNISKDTDKAVAEGVQKTGSIITSAALLLIVVVAAFGTSQIPLMKQLAVGLVLAIAIDAVLVRMLLVPATMKLLGRYNWWAPRPLKRLHEKLGFSE